MNADGKSDVIVGAETPDDPQIKIFDGSSGVLRSSFRPFGLVSAGTLRIATGDVDGDGRPEIVASATTSFSSTVRLFTADGEELAEVRAPLHNARSLTAGDLDGDGKAEIGMGAGPGYNSSIVAFDLSGTVDSWFQAYGHSFTNGVRVAAGDLDGDGALEYVTGQGPGGRSELLVLDAEGNELRELYPFGESWQGLYVAAGDVDGDARADIVAGAGSWSEPRVRVFGGSGSEKASFLAFDSGFQGGVRVATGDTNGDGKAEIVVGAGQGGPPVVRVFDAAGQRKASFFAFDSTSTSGIYVAAGDLDDDGNAEIVVGAGATGEVRVFDASGNLRTSFSAYHPIPYTEGVHVAVGDVNGDGNVEIVTGPGRVRPVDVGIFTGDGRWNGFVPRPSGLPGWHLHRGTGRARPASPPERRGRSRGRRTGAPRQRVVGRSTRRRGAREVRGDRRLGSRLPIAGGDLRARRRPVSHRGHEEIPIVRPLPDRRTRRGRPSARSGRRDGRADRRRSTRRAWTCGPHERPDLRRRHCGASRRGSVRDGPRSLRPRALGGRLAFRCPHRRDGRRSLPHPRPPHLRQARGVPRSRPHPIRRREPRDGAQLGPCRSRDAPVTRWPSTDDHMLAGLAAARPAALVARALRSGLVSQGGLPRVHVRSSRRVLSATSRRAIL